MQTPVSPLFPYTPLFRSMAHIGDSRGYLLRGDELEQVTTDHTFVQHLVDTGRLSQADAENHPKRNLVLRVLGDIEDRKSTRLNSSHVRISYAVFCLKKKN